MVSHGQYRPSRWTIVAGCAAAFVLPAWWAIMHPGIWGGREFEGLAQTIILLPLTMAGALVVFIAGVGGLIRKDPLAAVVLVATAGLAILAYALRDRAYG